MRVKVSQREYAARKLGEATLRTVVDAIHTEGWVVLAGAVSLPVLDAMKRKLDEDTAELLRRGAVGDPRGHLSQAMSCSPEHIHSDVVTNSLVIQVTARILGEGLHHHFYNCNTNLPGSLTQPLHRDAPHLWPDPVHPVTSIIVNVAPIDVTETNGAIELWPRTHRLLGATRIGRAEEDERRLVAPPIRAVTRKGDVLLRDPRLWHRGVPNRDTEPRHLVAMVHSKWFYQSDAVLSVTASALAAFDDEILTTRVEVVPDDYDYLTPPDTQLERRASKVNRGDSHGG